MFTGIIEEVGHIRARKPLDGGGAALTVEGPLAICDTAIGGSIAVNGVCLTVVERPGDGSFSVDLMPETLSRTSLGRLTEGSGVNLERAMPVNGRLHGHQVQGHVDGLGSLTKRTDADGWIELEINVPDDLAGLVAEKGSIALDGVSLTVTHVTASSLGVALIPETLRNTTLGELNVGDPINIEVDPVARYVARQMQAMMGTLSGETGDIDNALAALKESK